MSSEAENGGEAAHQRRSKRSLVLLAAKLRTPAELLDVRLRNLSQTGALLEGDTTPEVDGNVVFERGTTVVPARVAWVAGRRFGIEFNMPIEESEVLVHVKPPTRPASQPPADFRRSGFRGTRQLSADEQRVAQAWADPNSIK